MGEDKQSGAQKPQKKESLLYREALAAQRQAKKDKKRRFQINIDDYVGVIFQQVDETKNAKRDSELQCLKRMKCPDHARQLKRRTIKFCMSSKKITVEHIKELQKIYKKIKKTSLNIEQHEANWKGSWNDYLRFFTRLVIAYPEIESGEFVYIAGPISKTISDNILNAELKKSYMDLIFSALLAQASKLNIDDIEDLLHEEDSDFGDSDDEDYEEDQEEKEEEEEEPEEKNKIQRRESIHAPPAFSGLSMDDDDYDMLDDENSLPIQDFLGEKKMSQKSEEDMRQNLYEGNEQQ